MWTGLHNFPPVLTWTPPKIDQEPEVLLKVIHLWGDPRKHWKWSDREEKRWCNKHGKQATTLPTEAYLWTLGNKLKYTPRIIFQRGKETGVFIHHFLMVIGCRLLSSGVRWGGWGEVKSLSRVRLFATPWTVAHQASPSMGFSRQEYWSGLPLRLSPYCRLPHKQAKQLQRKVTREITGADTF